MASKTAAPSELAERLALFDGIEEEDMSDSKDSPLFLLLSGSSDSDPLAA